MSTKSKLTIVVLGILIVIGVATIYAYRLQQQDIAQRNHDYLMQGRAMYERGQYAEALELLQKVEPTAHEDWQVPFFKGSASIRLKDYRAAVTYLERARDLNPANAQTLYLLGVVYFKLGNLELSKGYFTATLELEPGHEEARGLMGVMSNLQKIQVDNTDEQVQSPESQ